MEGIPWQDALVIELISDTFIPKKEIAGAQWTIGHWGFRSKA